MKVTIHLIHHNVPYDIELDAEKLGRPQAVKAAVVLVRELIDFIYQEGRHAPVTGVTT